MEFQLQFYLIILVDTTQQTGSGPFSQGTNPICSIKVQERDRLKQLYHHKKLFIIYIPKYSLIKESIFHPIQCPGDLKESKIQGCKLFSHFFSLLLRTFHPQQAEHRCAKATSGHILCSKAIVAFHLINRKYLKPSLPLLTVLP